MQECMLVELAKQNEKISEQGTIIETMSRKVISLEEEVEIFTKLTKAIKLVWPITKMPGNFLFSNIQKRFQLSGYNFLFYFYNYSYNLQIGVYPQTGPNYDELKWPFKVEFVTHLSSQSNPGNIKRFKSEVLEWKRKDFYSTSYKSPTIIAIFTTDEFLKYFINSKAEFEIFVFVF